MSTHKKTHDTEEQTPHPAHAAGERPEGWPRGKANVAEGDPKAVHVEHSVHEGDLPRHVSMDDISEQKHKGKGKRDHQPFRFEGDKAFALNAEGKEVEVDPGNARDAAHACMEGDEAAVRKVAADVARLYPVA